MVCVIIHISSCNTWGTVKKGLRVDWGELEKVQQAVTHTQKNQTEKNEKTKHLSVALFFIEIYLFHIMYFKDSILKIFDVLFLFLILPVSYSILLFGC